MPKKINGIAELFLWLFVFDSTTYTYHKIKRKVHQGKILYKFTPIMNI